MDQALTARVDQLSATVEKLASSLDSVLTKFDEFVVDQQQQGGWSNKEWDSTIFLLGFLAMSGMTLWFGNYNPQFAHSEVAKSYTKIMELVWPLMVGYFFGKQNQNQAMGMNGMNYQIPKPQRTNTK